LLRSHPKVPNWTLSVAFQLSPKTWQDPVYVSSFANGKLALLLLIAHLALWAIATVGFLAGGWAGSVMHGWRVELWELIVPAIAVAVAGVFAIPAGLFVGGPLIRSGYFGWAAGPLGGAATGAALGFGFGVLFTAAVGDPGAMDSGRGFILQMFATGGCAGLSAGAWVWFLACRKTGALAEASPRLARNTPPAPVDRFDPMALAECLHGVRVLRWSLGGGRVATV
jgi:hypothetical protein